MSTRAVADSRSKERRGALRAASITETEASGISPPARPATEPAPVAVPRVEQQYSEEQPTLENRVRTQLTQAKPAAKQELDDVDETDQLRALGYEPPARNQEAPDEAVRTRWSRARSREARLQSRSLRELPAQSSPSSTQR